MKESDKVHIVQAMALHDVILRSKAELDQFCEGLESCGVLGAIRRNADLTRKYFCIDGCEKLTSGTLRCVLTKFMFTCEIHCINAVNCLFRPL